MTTDRTAEALERHFRFVIDNSGGDYLVRCELVEEARQSDTPRADLADKLERWARDMFFPWVYIKGSPLMYTDQHETGEPDPLNLMQREMLGVVIASIDWHAMASDYLSE